MTFPEFPTAGQVHLWVLEHRASSSEFLCESEQKRLQSYHFEKDRDRYGFTQSCKRILLGRYLGISPQEVSFGESAKGKPLLEGLEFSISHTTGLSALAVAQDLVLGIDIEERAPLPELALLAQRIMTSLEWAHVSTLPEAERVRAFYRLWTAKEAYLKNLGIGFEIEPHTIESNFPELTTVQAGGYPARFLLEKQLTQEITFQLATETPINDLVVFHVPKEENLPD